MSIRNLKIIDATTIQLLSEILRGVGRKRLDRSRQKGGIKVHALMDAFSGVTEFVRMTAAKENDVKFLYKLKLPAVGLRVYCLSAVCPLDPGEDLVCDPDERQCRFSCHQGKTRKRQAKGVLIEQYIMVAVKVKGIVTERLKIRRIMFKTDSGKVCICVTNNFTLPAVQIGVIY